MKLIYSSCHISIIASNNYEYIVNFFAQAVHIALTIMGGGGFG